MHNYLLTTAEATPPGSLRFIFLHRKAPETILSGTILYNNQQHIRLPFFILERQSLM